MPITANVLSRDSFNFFRNQFASILILALITAGISVVLNQVLATDVNILKTLHVMQGEFAVSTTIGFQELIQKMTPEQRFVILKVSAVAAFSALIGHALLIGGIMTLLRLVSQGERISAVRAICNSIPELPRLLLLLFVCTLMIQLGLSLFVVPGIIMSIVLSLALVISTTDKKGVFTSIRLSCKMALSNLQLITPAMTLWLAAKLVLFFIVIQQSLLTSIVTNLIITTISNLFSALLLIYLFRLYMLLHG